MNPSNGFRGEYRWLSNFYPAVVRLDGIDYPTVENAYQAAKLPKTSSDYADRTFTRLAPAAAKRLARAYPLPHGWEEHKVTLMTNLLRQKFKHPDLRARLLATEDAPIEETNSWNDVFWGVCKGKGKNMLGKIIMQIRADIRAGLL